ncbi:hypothetical protein LOTGIDRAFT_102583 [Lottia gigantea]|uniref:Nondiscriminating glutamyl-tRNA synthetase EARS2, mitochondrial n=1 Tax=Lottia gigantea TaxID=225164 RepID=V4AMQ8_LOTGI|nr:hypothetical protein LOTGIDRAFT_102583 [Lottia gigantea]ESP05464.1 hypothetical protein LOTGIDRAFT_102583 [Lottia gigantea]
MTVRWSCLRRYTGTGVHVSTLNLKGKGAGTTNCPARLYCLGRDDKVRVRFGPSPTGMLHLGGLRTALYNYVFAKANNGTFIIRIEDTDQTRCIEGMSQKLENDLKWAGLIPDESPKIGGDYGPYLQSQRFDLYQNEIKKLLDNHSAYHCFCSSKRLELLRKDAARRGEQPRYDNKCRNLTSTEVRERHERGDPFVVRLKMESSNESFEDLIKGPISHNVADIEGDPVLLKTDKFPTYHFANVVDDHHMKITHVLRGDEWLTSTPKHVMLYKAFGWEIPKFAHLPLILNRNGTKLSKRQNDIQVEYLRQSGYFPEAVINYVTKVGGGFKSENLTGLNISDLISLFDVKLIKSNSGRLDPRFLEESNKKQLVKKLKDDRQTLVAKAKKLMEETFPVKCKSFLLSENDYVRILEWGISEGRVTNLCELVGPKFNILWSVPTSDQLKEFSKVIDSEKVLHDCKERLKELNVFEQNVVLEVLRCHMKEENLSPKHYMSFIRMSLCGLKKAAPVAEILMVLGKNESINRLQSAFQKLSSN